MRNIDLPDNTAALNEMMSWMEIPRLMALSPGLLSMPRGEGGRVLVLPGFGAGDLSTLPLRNYLSSLGYRVSGWARGANTGDVPELIDDMRDHTEKEADSHGSPVALVGWSLGGYIAREVAREIPDRVSQVITLGSPVVGGPKYTRVAPLFEGRGMSLDEVEAEIDRRAEVPLKVPVTAIYSRRDGVVAWQACIDDQSDLVEHVEVTASHIGLGISADVYRIVASRLGGQLPG